MFVNYSKARVIHVFTSHGKTRVVGSQQDPEELISRVVGWSITGGCVPWTASPAPGDPRAVDILKELVEHINLHTPCTDWILMVVLPAVVIYQLSLEAILAQRTE